MVGPARPGEASGQAPTEAPGVGVPSSAAAAPVLEVEHGPEGEGRTRVVIRQLQSGEPFRFSLDLALAWPGGGRTETVEVREREEVFVLDTPAPMVAIELDPRGRLLHERAATRPGALRDPRAAGA